MSAPMQHPPDPLPAVEHGSRHVSPLLWLLLLAALLAFGWYFYNRRAVEVVNDASLPPPAAEVATPAAPAGTVPAGTRKPAQQASAAKKAVAKNAAAKIRTAASEREPQPIARVQPEYPPAAFRSGEQGTVLVRAQIDALGNPVSVEVVNSSRSRDLDRAAVAAVRKWRFEPARRNGKPVAAAVEVPIDFRLEQQ